MLNTDNQIYDQTGWRALCLHVFIEKCRIRIFLQENTTFITRKPDSESGLFFHYPDQDNFYGKEN
jgi:hypothetical protein